MGEIDVCSDKRLLKSNNKHSINPGRALRMIVSEQQK